MAFKAFGKPKDIMGLMPSPSAKAVEGREESSTPVKKRRAFSNALIAPKTRPFKRVKKFKKFGTKF